MCAVASGFLGGQCPSLVCHVTLTAPKDGVTAGGGRSC